MKLSAYLEEKKITAADFAGLIGVHKSTVSRWIDEDSKSGAEHRPGWDHLKTIAKVTEGAVTANDFVADDAPQQRVG